MYSVFLLTGLADLVTGRLTFEFALCLMLGGALRAERCDG
jgi:hypothetical protein